MTLTQVWCHHLFDDSDRHTQRVVLINLWYIYVCACVHNYVKHDSCIIVTQYGKLYAKAMPF